MKKLLLLSAILAITAIACGPSAEEQAKAQAENAATVDRKVNEIMEKLEKEAKAAEPEVMESDSAAADSAVVE
ncbi:MAG: hypothetical protein NWR30_07480 [Salibacteraceae bacterium]|jgi:hypothetical protein|nr:hypothetical protein [Salibacteraceae bacterium]